MKNFINLIKKYKLYILSVLLVIFFFRSCQKSVEIKRLNTGNDITIKNIDSLQLVIKQKQQKIDSFPEIMRVEKINIHLGYDGWISSRDRGTQLMELHSIVKNNVEELQKK